MIKLLNSFKNAFLGIISAIKNERNIRFHIVAASYVLWFSRFYDFTRVEYAILFIIIALVIGSELFNTAIENAVDLASMSYNKKAKCSKDAAAGAVLVFAFCAVAVGILFFADLDVLYEIYNFFRLSFFKLTLFILSIIISVIFIFFLFKPKKVRYSNNNEESSK